MLVLSRKKDESIVIGNNVGNNIVITVLKVSRTKVSLAIDAPDEVTILRSELQKDSDAQLPAQRCRQ